MFVPWESCYAFISLSLGSNIRETTMRAGYNPTRLNNLINCNGHAFLFLFNLNQFSGVHPGLLRENRIRDTGHSNFVSRLYLVDYAANREWDEN